MVVVVCHPHCKEKWTTPSALETEPQTAQLHGDAGIIELLGEDGLFYLRFP